MEDRRIERDRLVAKIRRLVVARWAFVRIVGADPDDMFWTMDLAALRLFLDDLREMDIPTARRCLDDLREAAGTEPAPNP